MSDNVSTAEASAMIAMIKGDLDAEIILDLVAAICAGINEECAKHSGDS